MPLDATSAGKNYENKGDEGIREALHIEQRFHRHTYGVKRSRIFAEGFGESTVDVKGRSIMRQEVRRLRQSRKDDDSETSTVGGGCLS